MAVNDFIPISESMKTVEKVVKPKPTLQELTTIESPGKPTSADQLENIPSRKPKRAPRKKPSTDAQTITRPESGIILIITEKPQAAMKIASALGNSRKITEKGVSYFQLERNEKTILVASAVGHLFNLTHVAGQKGWPIFELEWVPSYEKEKAAFTKRYYDTLKKLAKKAEDVIIATDYDVEGEVIGWNVLRFLCNRDTARRMKYSTLTKNELEESYEHTLPELNWGNAYAGEARHILDWLYGINLSRALMSAIRTTGSFKLLSIGRVQGPALKIIVDREKEIMNFKPESYWQVFAIVDNFEFKHPKDIFDKKELQKFENIKNGIAETTNTEESILPPFPFDLTTLQQEAYRLHKMSPSQTLATAQKLYLDGLISYPRTSSQKIPAAINPRNILKSLEKIFPEVKEATRPKAIEGKKDDSAHPSIYPTGEYRKLEENEKKLYDTIARRFIALFSKDAITQNKRVVITAENNSDITFRASGLKIKDKGWTKVYPATLEESDVPTLNGKVSIEKIKSVEKETQPPRRYTPASLVTTLEKKNLGTKSTRSGIIDTLFDRGYIDGRSLEATALGMRLIDALEKNSPIIIDENLTRSLEEEMDSITEKNDKNLKIKDSRPLNETNHSSSYSSEEKNQLRESKENIRPELEKMEKEIIEKAKRLITDISKEFKAHEIQIGQEILKGIQDLREAQKESNTLMQCPTCKKGDLRIIYSKKTQRSFIGCSNYPECKQTYSLPPNSLIKKSEKECPECRYPKLLAIRRGKRPWEFCFNTKCPTNIERMEKYYEKKRNEEQARTGEQSEPSN